MVQAVEEDESNMLEDMFFPTSSDQQETNRQHIPKQRRGTEFAKEAKELARFDSDDEDSDESEDECDADGAVAICDACQKVLPLSKYEKHISYYCRKKLAECPMCFEKFPMGVIQRHFASCTLKVVDPELVTCKYCKARMHQSELPDHAIAHLVHQNQVERQIVQRVADIEDFFEAEALEPAAQGKAPLLDKKQLALLPSSTFKLESKSGDCKSGAARDATSVAQEREQVHKCTICQMEFKVGESIRTLRCLHIFHRECIDKWLTEVNGCCVICKVVQSRPRSPTSQAQVAANLDLRGI